MKNIKVKLFTLSLVSVFIGCNSDFGDMNSNAQFYGGATSSRTRSYYMGGQNMGGSHSNQIQYFTMSSTGNGTDYGDLDTNVTYSNSGASNGTR